MVPLLPIPIVSIRSWRCKRQNKISIFIWRFFCKEHALILSVVRSPSCRDIVRNFFCVIDRIVLFSFFWEGENDLIYDHVNQKTVWYGMMMGWEFRCLIVRWCFSINPNGTWYPNILRYRELRWWSLGSRNGLMQTVFFLRESGSLGQCILPSHWALCHEFLPCLSSFFSICNHHGATEPDATDSEQSITPGIELFLRSSQKKVQNLVTKSSVDRLC